jgi:hypothetical protein
MDFSPASLLASLFIGAIGFGLFLYGKKRSRIPHLVSGLVLMVFPYFVPGAVAMVLIAATIIGMTWLAGRYGW